MARQRRIHFTKESDARRKQILDALGELALEVTIYDGSAHRAVGSARRAIYPRRTTQTTSRAR
jgi:hypothetical protein